MTQNSFLNLIRTYAALSRRFNKSYAEAVNAIIQSRHDAIMGANLAPEETRKQTDALFDMATREYGKVDRDFKVNIIPF